MLELQNKPSLYQTVKSSEIKKKKKKETISFPSAWSRGPDPKWQLTLILLSGHMAIAHTGKPYRPGVGELSQAPQCLSEQASRPSQAGSNDRRSTGGNQHPKRQSCAKGIISSVKSLLEEVWKTRFWQQQLSLPSALVIGSVFLFGSHVATSRSHPGGWKEELGVSSKVIHKDQWKEYKICSVQQQKSRSVFNSLCHTRSFSLEWKSPPCWSVCQGPARRTDPWNWRMDGVVGGEAGQMRLPDQASQWLVEDPCPWLGSRGTNSQCSLGVLQEGKLSRETLGQVRFWPDLLFPAGQIRKESGMGMNGCHGSSGR